VARSRLRPLDRGHLKGPFSLVQALSPRLANPASIILIASNNARIGVPSSSVYAATKAGLMSLARTLSGELIGRGIRVNAVSPGPIATSLRRRVTRSIIKKLRTRRSIRARPVEERCTSQDGFTTG
jgi:NAD(P)-dependent dehydrogenase (short-subunit alcohol dehydrogenase family)